MPAERDDFYEFDCGCRIPIDRSLPPVHGRPSLIYRVEDMPLDCPRVWDMLGRGLTKGVFQLESRLGRKWVKRLRPENIEHLAALTALLRPGCLRTRNERGLSMTDMYCLRKSGEEPVTVDIPAVEDILASTFQTYVYQEQVMQIAQRVANFDLVEVDKLRKCVTKDTRFVSRTRGWISIERLLKEGYADDQFLVMDESGYQSWKPLEKIWSTGKHDVLKVQSSSGSFVHATTYHQFLTDQGWKARSRLNPETDYLVAAREVEYDGEDRISRDMAHVIAGIVTEGYFVERRATFVNHDKTTMDSFVAAFTAEFGHSPSMSPDGRTALILKEDRDRLSAFINYGLSDSRRLPDVMMGMSKETTRDFLSRLLSYEGGVAVAGSYEFSSKSPELAMQVKLLLLRFGIRSLFSGNEDKERYRVCITDVEEQRKLQRELTQHWTNEKVDTLNQVVARKESQYTTDVFPRTVVRRLIDQYPFIGRCESGTLYTAPISRLRLQRVSDIANDPYWIDLTRSKHWYDRLRSVEERMRQIETFDFTVAGGDTPYIVANGLVIHNSMGKKDQKAMTEVGVLFVDKAEKYGVVTRNQAEILFDNIRKSGKYLFNASHSYSYAIDSYWTAHEKAHFPLEFFTSYLYYAKEKQKPLEEIRALINEAKVFGIEVKPPRFSDLEDHFFNDGVEIRFGLSDVKGVGEKKVVKMKEAMAVAEKGAGGKPVTSWSWFDFLVHFSGHLDSTLVKRMIEVGALRDFGMDRVRLLAEYDAWRRLTDGERKHIAGLKHALTKDVPGDRVGKFIEANPGCLPDPECLVYNADGAVTVVLDPARPVDSLADAIEQVLLRTEGNTLPTKREPSRPKPVVSGRRREAVESIRRLLLNPPSPLVDKPYWIAKKEEEVLGLPITCTHVDSADRSRVNATCRDVREGVADVAIIGVEVQHVHEVITRNGQDAGKPMAFLTVSDGTGELGDVVVFASTWEKFGHILGREHAVVAIAGRRDPARGGFIVDRVWEI